MEQPYKKTTLYIALTGKSAFVFFYILAAMKYPGGSWVHPKQNGFSFWNNYLCDLLDIYAINGEVNLARPFSIAALGLLCIGIFSLWFYLPQLFKVKSFNQKIMRISGLLSLLIILFLAFGDHDIVVRIAGVFGVIAFISCSIELFKTGYKKLFLFGLLCLLVFIFNYYIYETGQIIESLPVIQKITFVLYISWFIALDIALYRKFVQHIRYNS